MKAGKVLKYFIKLAISGILALIILSVLCLFYYNPPMPTPQFQEYSNTKYIENRFWVSFREGFGFGKTNELGYNDAPIQNPSASRIAFVGSSNTVGLQMRQKDTFARLTEELLLSDDNSQNDYECMNVASAGQFFETSVSNIEPLAKSFDNLAFVVIEAPSYNYSEEDFYKMLRGEYHVEPASSGIIYRIAQSSPYLRLLANQYQSMMQHRSEDYTEISASPVSAAPDYEAYERGFRAVAEMLGGIANEYGFRIILLQHGMPVADAEHIMHNNQDVKKVEILSRCCSDNGIIFLDMCQEFADYHNSTSASAYGFPNTSPNTGHLNKTGHNLIAQRIYETVSEIGEVQ